MSVEELAGAGVAAIRRRHQSRFARRPPEASRASLPARTREAQNAPLGEIDKNHWGCAFALSPQLAIALQESAHHYDEPVSGRILYAYSPYGETTALGADEGNPIQYTARENDGTGLYYYRARYYDPVLKRFITEDPIGLAGGINAYAYVDNAPTIYTDPEGLKPPIVVRQPSTREIVRHPEVIQPRPTLRENPGVRNEFMDYAKAASDFLKGYREQAMRDYLREQGIDLPHWHLPPPPPRGCIYICPAPRSIQNRVPNVCYPDGPENCMLWCGPRMSAY